ncbi:MAG: vanadium-dependent haloperoxidase, partial [Phycisphaeraceae bacterium]
MNSVTRVDRPLVHINYDAPDASIDAAGAAAAHRVLSHFYPERQNVFDATLNNQLSGVQNARQRSQGVALGRSVADYVIENRNSDGWDTQPNYTAKDEPGRWRPTPPNYAEDPFTPHWGDVRPWAVESGAQFAAPDPPALDSAEYAEAFNRVKAVGARDSSTRTQEQTDIAMFWSNDRAGTYLPIGHLNHITQVVAADQNLSTQEQARLFALTNIAMADAGIASWHTKYETDFWRPVTAIREADSDGNPDTEADADWLPLYPSTPTFPAYTSGHAAFSGAHAAVMEAFFGTDDISFTITTDEALYEGPEFRTYDSFSEAALENAESRVLLGVHFDFDGIEGNTQGVALGQYVHGALAHPIPEPTTGVM